jgi:hypothetical protein
MVAPALLLESDAIELNRCPLLPDRIRLRDPTLLLVPDGALGVDRTRDLSLTKGVLYH